MEKIETENEIIFNVEENFIFKYIGHKQGNGMGGNYFGNIQIDPKNFYNIFKNILAEKDINFILDTIKDSDMTNYSKIFEGIMDLYRTGYGDIEEFFAEDWVIKYINEIKDYSKFHKNENVKFLLSRINKYYKLKEIKDANKNSYLKNKKEFQKLRKTLTPIVYSKYGKECNKCHKQTDLTIGHKIALFNGGNNEIENLQVLCRNCNSDKSNIWNF